ncbi:Ig-like domain-containing protein [Breznakibacter xylanolyticus]|nr:Ig-like domain-containing protein [Breznakibacter xylanolyticus]
MTHLSRLQSIKIFFTLLVLLLLTSGTILAQTVVVSGGVATGSEPNGTYTYAGTTTVSGTTRAFYDKAGSTFRLEYRNNPSYGEEWEIWESTDRGGTGTVRFYNESTSTNVPTTGWKVEVGNTAPTVAYFAAPSVSGISPTSGPAGGGTSVTITGTDFTGVTAVQFGSTAATGFTVNSTTQITATAPAGSAGNVNVTVTTAGGTSTIGAANQYTYWTIPMVTSVAVPANATYGVGQNLDFTVNFNKAITVNATGGTPYLPITLNTGGTVNAAYNSGSGTSALTFRYTVAAGNNDADGVSVGSAITANGGTLKDGSGNNATLTLNSVSSTAGVKVDGVEPSVTTVSASTANGSYKIGDVIAITVQFSESVVVTGTPTLALATGGTAAYSSGSGSSTLTFSYTVGTGHVSADLDYTSTSSLSLAGGTIKDVAGNNASLTLASPGAANSLGANKAIVIDGVVPTVTITSTSAAITYTTPIPVTVTFSEAVTNFISSDVTLTNGTIGSFSGSGTTYTFSVTPSGQGLVTVAIAAGVAQDAAGNLSTAATSLTRTFDSVNPTVVLSTTAPSTTNAAIPVTVTFSEDVTGLSLSDFSVTNATLSALSGSGKTYTLTATPSAQGAVSISLPNASALDVAQLGNVASNQLNFTYDTGSPSVSITSASNSATNASPIAVTITFSESVSGFVVGDLTLTNGTASGFAGSGTTYTVNIAPSGQGLVTVAVAAGVAQDAAGNLSTAATSLTRTYDNVSPTVSITSASNSSTNASTIPVTITFSESVTGFIAGDLTVTNGTASGFAGSGTTYTVNIVPVGQGLVTVAIAAGVAQDAVGNLSAAATSLTRTFDNVSPTVSITSASNSSTNASTIPVTITFSESVTGFEVGDLTVTNGTYSVISGTGTTYTVNIAPSGQGLVTVAIAAGVAQDAAGNLCTAATSLTRTYDNEAPVISGVVNSGTYTSAQSRATLAKDAGTAVAYASGTAINASGSYVLTVTDAAGNLATASFTITLSTGIADERKPSLSVYPNPCTDSFRVSGIEQPADVTITDLTGRVVLKTMVDVDGDVPVGHLKQGTYLVKVNERVLKLIFVFSGGSFVEFSA